MAFLRPAALDLSALSPQEYDEYIPRLSHPFEASFSHNVGTTELRIPPVEVWQWLTQWIDAVEERREKEILSFFRLPTSNSISSLGSTDYPPALQTLLALTRLYSHSKDTRHLTRDLLFVQADPVVWKVEPRATRTVVEVATWDKGKEREMNAEPHPPPPIRTASLVGKPTLSPSNTIPATNPFRRPPPLATASASAPLVVADLGLPTPPSSTSSFPPAVSGASLQRAVSNPTVPVSVATREREPPMPPPKRLPLGQSVEGAGTGAAAGAGLRRASTNPFRRSEDAGARLEGEGKAGKGPISEGRASSSTSSGGSGGATTSLPPLPPRPLSTPAFSKPPSTPASKSKPPLPPSSSKPLRSKPALPSRRASLPAPTSATAPRLSIISSSSHVAPPPASPAPTPPPSLPSRNRLTSSTHIGIGSSVRLISTTRNSLSHHSQGESKEHSPAHSNAGSGSGAGGIKGRMSRSNSGVSTGGAEGEEGSWRYETATTSPRKGRGRSGSQQKERAQVQSKKDGGAGATASPFADSPSLSRSRSRSGSMDSSSSSNSSSAGYVAAQSARTAPLPSTSRFPSSTFPSFTTASVIPPPSNDNANEENDALYGVTSLARSKTVGSKPRGLVPPPPKRRIENPFDSPSTLGIGRPPNSASATTTQQQHRRTTSLTSRQSSVSAPAASGIGAEVVGFLEKGAREGEGWLERAREGLGRRASGRRRGEEGERLVERDSSSSDEEVGGREGEEVGVGVGEDEMKDLERSVRERVERGQWRQLGE